MKGVAAGAIFAFLAGCGAQEVILPGERVDIRARPASATLNQPRPIALPAQVVTRDWTHRAATPGHAMPHAALAAAPAAQWAVPIGQGNDKRHRISAFPVSDGTRVYAMDSRARLSAVTTGGQIAWQRDLTPAGENADDASGGGLALGGGTLFVATGFGELHALDAATGRTIWVQRLDAPVAGAPTVSGGQIYLATRDSRGWVLDAATGRIRWTVTGGPSLSGLVGGAAPAVGGGLAVFPFGSGQLTATYPREGFTAWTGSVTGARLGRAYAYVTDVTGDPLIAGGRVYVGNPGGRIVALDSQTGARVWTSETGALGPMVLAGGNLFTVSDEAALVRLDARSGQRIWAAPLPGVVPVEREKRRRDVFANFGPILAGGRLWVASNDGFLRGFDPVSGAPAGQIALGAGASTPPIVVGRSLYLVTDDGMLRAFR